MFFGSDSDHGGERGALLYGLIGTCRLNGIDPEAYLRHILSVLPEWPSNRVGELLPWNVVNAKIIGRFSPFLMSAIGH